MQTSKQHAQGVALGFVEDGEEFPAAKKKQSTDIIERVEKTDCRRDQNERDHQARPGFIHAAEQSIEHDGEADENHLTHKIAEDRKTKHGFVSENIFGGCGGVPAHDEFSRNVDQAEWSG